MGSLGWSSSISFPSRDTVVSIWVERQGNIFYKPVTLEKTLKPMPLKIKSTLLSLEKKHTPIKFFQNQRHGIY